MVPKKSWNGCILLLLVAGGVRGQQDRDLFNYGMSFLDENGANSFGQDEWGFLSCDDIDECPGYPNSYEHGYFSLEGDSQCRWCPDSDAPKRCGLHRQSPIDLKRYRAVTGHEDEKECPDWHWMQYRDDSCTFDDMRDSFSIERHALQIHIPTRSNGDIACRDDAGRRYPRIDYSKGFPDWWYMARMDVSVPSQHTQDGRQYAAEVTLAHFYEVDHFKNHLGHIGLFMQDYEDEDPWPFLDKLICNWRLEEERVREACGLPPVKPYGRCRLFRGQPPTTEWLVEAGIIFEQQTSDETSEPSASPVTNFPTFPTDIPTNIPSIPAEPDPQSKPVIVQVPLGVPISIPVATAPLSSTPTPSPTEASSIAGTPSLTETSSIVGPPVALLTPAASPIVLKPIVPILLSTDRPSSLVPEPTDRPSIFFTDDDMFELSEPPSISPSMASSDVGSFEGSTINPTPKESAIESATATSIVPPPIACRSYPIHLGRFCAGADPCCESTRSDSSACWRMYDILGDAVPSACYHCCSSPKLVGPATPVNPGLPQTMQCSDVDNPHRMCKENSCCSNPRTDSRFCREQYMKLGDLVDEVCYYCCSEPKEVGPRLFPRNLRQELEYIDDTEHEGAKAFTAFGKRFLLHGENFDEDEDEEEYFNRLYEKYNRRSLQGVVHSEDYEDIDWFPYEWMLKVDTEYYFRYEGTMMVPPCWETVHWRFMKDPIRVHPRQIKELNRLLAWRRNPGSCEIDTAGVMTDDGHGVKVNRELQYQTSIHRSVFCECKDWPSKFEKDKQWCKNYKQDMTYERFYENPYNFMAPP